MTRGSSNGKNPNKGWFMGGGDINQLLIGTAIGIQCVKCLWVFNRKFRSLWQLMTILNSDQKLFKAVIGCIRFLSRSNSPVAVPMYLMPAHINLVEREDVSFPKSERSISTVDKFRVAASSAAPMYFPSYQMEDKSWMIDGSIITNNPTLVGYTYSKKLLDTNNIRILSIGSGQNKTKIDGENSTNWGGVGWLRNDIMGMLLDSEIHNQISNSIFDDNYLRINSPLGKVNRFLDDDSDENLEKIHLMGMEWWSDFGDQALKFIET